jgi:phage tail sheath protein FI
MSFLHGVEIKESTKSAVLAAGDSSVIALVGTAGIGSVGVVKLITSRTAGVAEYGEDIGGFTIPAALDFIFAHVAAKVLVVNVLDNADALALLEENGKMTIDVDGKFATHIGEATLPAAVDFAADIVNGLELLSNIEDSIGIKPNLIIAPGYSQLATVMAKMITVAEKLNAFALVDVVAADVTAVLAARTNGAYASASPALILSYPAIMRYNAHESANQPIGLSVAIAVAKAATDSILGYWISPSNYELAGILGTVVPVKSSITDPTADTNLLNGAGVVTVLRRAGSGYRVWGNWTAAFPTEKGAEVMIAPRAVRMMIREVLIDAAITYLDRNNINKLTVERIQNDVNTFMRGLIGKGAINSGECSWDAEKNPSSEISQGKLLYTISVTYGPSLDKLTFEEVVETNFNL